MVEILEPEPDFWSIEFFDLMFKPDNRPTVRSVLETKKLSDVYTLEEDIQNSHCCVNVRFVSFTA